MKERILSVEYDKENIDPLNYDRDNMSYIFGFGKGNNQLLGDVLTAFQSFQTKLEKDCTGPWGTAVVFWTEKGTDVYTLMKKVKTTLKVHIEIFKAIIEEDQACQLIFIRNIMFHAFHRLYNSEIWLGCSLSF